MAVGWVVVGERVLFPSTLTGLSMTSPGDQFKRKKRENPRDKSQLDYRSEPIPSTRGIVDIRPVQSRGALCLVWPPHLV
jgi:hypothetical protein